MNDDKFETRLKRQPFRPVPELWRESILSAAKAGALAGTAASDGKRGERPRVGVVAAWWRESLWPHPAAWGMLAAAWMVILALNGFGLKEDARAVAETPVPSPDLRAALLRQREWLREMLASDSIWSEVENRARRGRPPMDARPRGAMRVEAQWVIA